MWFPPILPGSILDHGANNNGRKSRPPALSVAWGLCFRHPGANNMTFHLSLAEAPVAEQVAEQKARQTCRPLDQNEPSLVLALEVGSFPLSKNEANPCFGKGLAQLPGSARGAALPPVATSTVGPCFTVDMPSAGGRLRRFAACAGPRVWYCDLCLFRFGRVSTRDDGHERPRNVPIPEP